MSSPAALSLGVMFRRENPPETLPAYVRAAEALALDELWLVEDCFYAGGVASAAIALALSERLRVGLGIMPAVARNPAFSALEIAALARTYPGRFLAGIGHGVADWMRQIGAFPASQLAALGETADAVRRLLAGETVTTDGAHVHLDRVTLEFAPQPAPPVMLGVRGPKSLQLSGRVADGTILAELASPAYVRWAREQIAQGAAAAGRRDAPHRVTVYALLAADSDGAAARARLRPVLAALLATPQPDYVRALDIERDVETLRAGGVEQLAAAMPDAWIEALSVAGTPEACAASVQALHAAGADSIVFVPERHDVEGLTAVRRVLDALGR